MQYCPVCGKSCREIYRDQGGWGVAVGCEHCYTPPIYDDALKEKIHFDFRGERKQ